MTEKQEIKSSKELIIELLTRLHPEADLNDEEVLFGIIYDDYDDYAKLIESREDDIAKAQAAGELKGRNTTIEELMHEEPEGDGVPSLGGANTVYRERGGSIFDLANLTR